MKYFSTRGNNKSYTFSEILLQGIAEDGGLSVPEKIPSISLEQICSLQNKTYQEIALFIFSLFDVDFPKNDLKEIINKAYANNFDDQEITPLKHLKNNQYMLELWHGPTFAFKDIALQIMPLLFSKAAAIDNQNYLILTATSGDTGKAALEGYKNKKHISLVVLYPDRHVSVLQEKQMITTEGKNVAVYAVENSFDSVQKLVKSIFVDDAYKKRLLKEFNTKLSSANSINFGRLLPQIVYHFKSYIDLIKKGAITCGDPIDIAVPSGNFGNILAAFLAKQIGLPIQKLICASNENNSLAKFIQTGTYSVKNKHVVYTPSPAIDILVASNIERLLYFLTKDNKKVIHWMNDLKTKGEFTVDDTTKKLIQQLFYADWVNNKDCLQNIKKVFQETKYLMDPHTSVAQKIADQYINNSKSKNPIVICSTAHFAKFAGHIEEALLNKKSGQEFDSLKAIIKHTGLTIPQAIANLQTKPVIHTQKLPATQEVIENSLMTFLKNQHTNEEKDI